MGQGTGTDGGVGAGPGVGSVRRPGQRVRVAGRGFSLEVKLF